MIGRPALAAAAAAAGLMAALHRAPPPRREVFRAEILRRTLAGRREVGVRAAADRVFPRLEWNEDMLARYAWHRAERHRILVATGGLAIYMPILLDRKGLRPDGLLASEMVTVNGVLTGEMAGPACTWEEKARRIRLWLDALPPEARDGEIWAYGNLPNDGAMLALADHKTVI